MKSQIKNWYKKIFQFGILGILAYMGIRIAFSKSYSPDFEAYCPFGGLQALGSYLTRDSLSCSMTSVQILMGIVLFIAVVIFGKLFCGYICPLGTIGELLGKIGDRLKIRFTFKGIADKLLRSLKYILLFLTFYFTLESSELFCKKFDPYYAVASGFNADVALLYALVAILVLILGSVFVRLFWCRYTCPLGALSNIFKYSWIFLGIMGVYILLIVVGLDIPYYYPLAIIVLSGYLMEILRSDRVKPNLVRITRNTDSCINCNLCSNRCPQGIDVANMKVVSDVDCTLCGDCLYECPEKDTLQINRSNRRWLPALVIVILVSAGLFVSTFWEVPTIDVKWGTPEELHNAAVYTKPGLKNIKCFGSSTAFANQMRRVPGIYGVATFVGSHTVKIYYDSNRYSEEKLQEIMFVPQKKIVSTAGKDVDSLSVYRLEIDQFFDPLDATYLSYLLKQKTLANGFLTEFACPVKVIIYFPAGKETSPDLLTEILESKSLTYDINGKEYSTKLNYRVISLEAGNEYISKREYGQLMFNPVEMKFNKYNTYTPDVLKEVEFRMGINSSLKARYTYLVSHISNDKGVVAFETWLDDNAEEMGKFIYVDTMTREIDILKQMNADTLQFSYSSGSTGKIANPFNFMSELKAISEKENK